jgi:exodeoxyribonuclease V beta subunit
MAHEHYYLQYLIYTVAVHRYLSVRLENYSYERHFGGVAYMFLRGLNEEGTTGIYFDKPDSKLITALDECFLNEATL